MPARCWCSSKDAAPYPLSPLASHLGVACVPHQEDTARPHPLEMPKAQRCKPLPTGHTHPDSCWQPAWRLSLFARRGVLMNLQHQHLLSVVRLHHDGCPHHAQNRKARVTENLSEKRCLVCLSRWMPSWRFKVHRTVGRVMVHHHHTGCAALGRCRWGTTISHRAEDSAGMASRATSNKACVQPLWHTLCVVQRWAVSVQDDLESAIHVSPQIHMDAHRRSRTPCMFRLTLNRRRTHDAAVPRPSYFIHLRMPGPCSGPALVQQDRHRSAAASVGNRPQLQPSCHSI